MAIYISYKEFQVLTKVTCHIIPIVGIPKIRLPHRTPEKHPIILSIPPHLAELPTLH